MDDARMRLLMLGGTTEASALARLLAGRDRYRADPVARRPHASPKPLPLPMRIGGFGGVEGLALSHGRTRRSGHRRDASVRRADVRATRVAACDAAGVPLAVLTRPPWRREAGDAGSRSRRRRPRRRRSGRKPRARVPEPSAGCSSPLSRRAAASLSRPHRSTRRRDRAAAGYPRRLRRAAPFDASTKSALLHAGAASKCSSPRTAAASATYPARLRPPRAARLPGRDDRAGRRRAAPPLESAADRRRAWLDRGSSRRALRSGAASAPMARARRARSAASSRSRSAPACSCRRARDRRRRKRSVMIRSSARPTARAKATGGCRRLAPAQQTSKASWICCGRAFEAGL